MSTLLAASVTGLTVSAEEILGGSPWLRPRVACKLVSGGTLVPDHDAPFAGPLGSLGGRDQSCWRHIAATVRHGIPPTQVGFRRRGQSTFARF